MISFARKQYVRKISAQVGTSKRLHSLSLGAGAVMLFPFAVYKYFTAPTFEFSFGTVVSIVIFSVFFLVFDYYVDIVSHAKIGATSAVVMTGLISCCAFAFLSEWWNQGPGFAFLNLFCFVVLLFGVYLRFGLEGRGKSKGGLADLPLHSGALSAHYSVTSRRVWQFLKASLHEIIRNGESRSIFGFLLLNLTFMFVEMVYGFWTNSLGLISDAFHMLFDCTALLIGLYASVISKWEANQVFTYGYARVEVLSGFVNSVFLVCIAFFVLLESIERFLEPPKIDTERLLLVSFLGLLVNLVGVFAFSHGHSHGHSHGGESHGHSHAQSHSHSKKKKHGHGHSHSHGHGHDEHHDDHSHSHSHSHSHAHSHHFEAEQHSHHSHQHSHPHHRKDSKKYDDFHHHHHHEKEEDLFHNNSNNNTWKAILLQPWNKAKEMISGGISENLSGIWLHVMADTLGSVGVIISSLCVMYFDWAIADPICSFCIALLILLSIIPLLKGSAATLAQRTPENMEGDLRNLVQKVVAMEVVMGVREVHFWRHSGDVIVGTMHVQIQNEADEQKVQRKVHKLFGGLVEHLTVQVEKERFFELETQLQKQNNPISYAAFMTPASTPSFGMAASPSSSSSSLTSLASPSSSFASLSSSSFSSSSSSSSSALLVPQMIVEQL
ncbi:Zinc transporter 5 [Balamuthia mandrillaris]